MQEIHSIGNVGSRLFGGGGAGDRRVRQHHQQNQQALKCPRCDSLNTKFCYYNNYNLSQPRHFCKSCRRYWTKGGVLRNVPVGGGCRKTKRSKLKQTATDHNTNSAAGPTPSTIVAKQQQEEELKSSNSHSSSESSSLTAANAAAGLEAVSTTRNGIGESKLFVHHQNMNTSYEHGLLEHGSDCGIFSEIGNFTNLINFTNDNLPFGFGNMMNQQQGLEHVQQNQNSEQQREKEEREDIGGGLINDQTVHVELSALQSSHASENNAGSCFGGLDWQGSGGGLFDLPNAVDQTYWSQSQWTDQDHHTLYLP